MPITPIPNSMNAITACLTVRDATAALVFYQQAFFAKVLIMLKSPDGKLAHGEIKIGESVVMLVEEVPDSELASPQTLGGAGVSLLVYVEEVDKVYAHAIAAGAEIVCPIEDQFYGDRAGTLCDPFGHVWTIASRIENLSTAEIEERAKVFFKRQAGEA